VWEQAAVLAARLAGLGFGALAREDTEDPVGDWPVIEVSSGPGLRVHEDGVVLILVAPDDRRVPCLWWESMEPVAPLSDLGAAVVTATRLLPCPGAGCPRCSSQASEFDVWQEA
jgi:hypothetical protein